MNIITLTLIAICILLNVGAQLALKQGAVVNIASLGATNFFTTVFKLFTSNWIIIGGIAYIASVFVWLLVLNRVEVSKAYPLISIGYIVNAIAAYYLLDEHVTLMRMAGIAIILTGVYIVARS